MGLGLLVPVGAARAQDVWSIAASGRGAMTDVAAGPRRAYLVLAHDGETHSAVLRVAASGRVRRLARLSVACTDIVALADGGAVGVCGAATLYRVRADGRRTALAIQWPVDVRYVDAIAAAPGGLLIAVTIADVDAQVFRAGADGTAVRVAGGGTRPAATDGVPATALRLGEITSLAADGGGFVFAHEEHDADLVRHVGADGEVTTVAGGGPPTPLRDGLRAPAVRIDRLAETRPELAVLPGGDVLLAAGFVERRTLIERLVRVDARSGRLRILATPGFHDGFNLGDGGPFMRASLHPAALAAGADGDVAIVDGAAGTVRSQLRWLDAPRAPRLAVAVTATRAGPPAVSLRATHRARMTIAVRRRGETVVRMVVRGLRATRRLGRLRAGAYTVRVTATDGRSRQATDEVPLHIGRNPTSGADCTRISALRVDCLHPETSLNDVEFGYVVVLRPDGQLWQADVDPGSRPGAPVPAGTGWDWIA
ncbi:MAG: hypothetical protein ACXVFL_00900 [Solirubrobacteraceae bacterium]